MNISPRQKRFIECLLLREHSRKELGELVGSLNVCDVKFRLVNMGLNIVCNRKPMKDRDGKTTRPGYYSIAESEKPKVRDWLASFTEQANQNIKKPTKQINKNLEDKSNEK